MHLVEQIAECMLFGQVANFKTNSNIEIDKIPYAINSKLKKSIVIKEAEEVEERFHSRYNAKQKTYRYIINNSLQFVDFTLPPYCIITLSATLCP